MRGAPRIVGGIALALAALLSIAVLGARTRGRSGPIIEPPLESTLPTLPTPTENGWELIAAAPRGTFDVDPPTLRTHWRRDEVAEMRAMLEAWSVPPPAEAVIEAAYARPRVLPACELRLGVACNTLPWVTAHRVASARALENALTSEPSAVDLARLVVADDDAVRSARILIAGMTALVCLADVLERGQDLLALLDAAPSEGLVAAARRLQEAVRGIVPAAYSPAVITTGEWIAFDRELAAAQDSLDFRALAGPYYQGLVAYAADASAGVPRLPTTSTVDELFQTARWQASIYLDAGHPAQIDGYRTRVTEIEVMVRAILEHPLPAPSE